MYGFHQNARQAAVPEDDITQQARASFRRRFGFANGGLVTGPGTGTSDDIETQVPQGSYVLPADTTEALGMGFGPNSRGERLAAGLPEPEEQPAPQGYGFRPNDVPVNLSNGEYVVPPEQVEGFGVQFLNDVKDATHTPATGPMTQAAQVGGFGFRGRDDARLYMADGGLVTEREIRQQQIAQQNAAGVARRAETAARYDAEGADSAAAAREAFANRFRNQTLRPAQEAQKPGTSDAGQQSATPTSPAADDFDIKAIASRYKQPQAEQRPVQADVRRVDNAIDRSSGASSVPTPAPAPATDQAKALDGLSGVYKHSRNEYSDNPNGMGFGSFTGRPTAQNDAAATTLANRYKPTSAPPAPGYGFGPGSELERQSQNITPHTSGSGYGLLDQGYRDRRAAMMDAAAMKPGARTALTGVLREQSAAADRGFQSAEAAANRGFQSAEAAADRGFRGAEAEANRGLQREGLAADVANNQARIGIDQQRVNLEENDPARAVARQVLALRDRVLNARSQQERARAAQDLAMVEGRTGQGLNKETQQRASDAQDIFSIVDEARPLLGKATNSYFGAGIDKALQAFGISTDSGDAAGQLKALQGALVMKMPRMEGPQSDKDTQLYREMAGQIGDPTVPASVREAAMRTIESLHIKYLPQVSSEADIPNLAPGTWFKAPNGSIRRAPQ